MIDRKDEISTEKTGGKKLEDIPSVSTGKVKSVCCVAAHYIELLKSVTRILEVCSWMNAVEAWQVQSCTIKMVYQNIRSIIWFLYGVSSMILFKCSISVFLHCL